MTSIEQYIKQIPKIELHAHIGGSIRESTIIELLQQKSLPIETSLVTVSKDHDLTLEECFQRFDIIHKVTDNLSTIKRITYEVLDDFYSVDNCKYVELRSGPREFVEHGTTNSDYVQSVLDTMNKYHYDHPDHYVTCPQLLLSVNRSHSVQKAEEVIKLAIQYFNNNENSGICGIDFSGNCYAADFAKFEHLFEYARSQHNIPITLHFAECDNYNDSKSILNFHPNRVGHAAVVTRELEDDLMKRRIPIEICFTSNLLCRMHESHDKHPFRTYYKNNHPMIICTDDKGVFNTDLCREYEILASQLSGDELQVKQQLFDIASSSVESCFCSDHVKQLMRDEYEKFKQIHLVTESDRR